MMGGNSRREKNNKKKAKQKCKGHEYGLRVSFDLNIYEMTISMS